MLQLLSYWWKHFFKGCCHFENHHIQEPMCTHLYTYTIQSTANMREMSFVGSPIASKIIAMVRTPPAGIPAAPTLEAVAVTLSIKLFLAMLKFHICIKITQNHMQSLFFCTRGTFIHSILLMPHIGDRLFSKATPTCHCISCKSVQLWLHQVSHLGMQLI